ncbi:Na+/H+ antiporter [Hydrocarboniphaga sp.]|uniref:Na+/H+ antiporter n=1 Tax=Hydrocarboniphaga sp. TaxID=2033016 RepID=UPI002638BA94|nr:Na+/H+ antiporter [Hydrocarboniphaga sp.]
MNAAILVLTLLLCVAISAIIVRVARLPLPLTQIALGAVISVPSYGLHVDLEPHLFLLLFVPPLLFADGWRMPKREFFQARERILALAFGLVLFTVFAVGYLLHWMIPQLPLAAAFALAAVLSPTDAVAVSALAGRTGIPKRLMYTLEGEALMNDASGLTAFKFAVAAAATGAFSLYDASMAFVLVAIGGVAIGALMGWGMALFQQWLAGWTRVQAQGTIVLILLLPFAAYLIAEEAGTSGILAAVAAGITLNLKSAADTGADTRIATTHIWSMLEYVLNGVIFVLMGLQLPDIILDALSESFEEGGWRDPARLLTWAAATWAALIFARLIWVWGMLRVTHLAARWRGDRQRVMPRRRLLFATALAGVRGAITLAGVLSLPFVIEGDAAFPQRSLMVFLAASVILISLIAAAIGLPWLLRGMAVEEDPEEREEQLARIQACEAAVAAIAVAASEPGSEREEEDENSATSRAAQRMIQAYQQRLRSLREEDGPANHRERSDADLALRLIGIRAERNELMRMHRADEINDVVLNALLYEIDVRETSLTPRGRKH